MGGKKAQTQPEGSVSKAAAPAKGTQRLLGSLHKSAKAAYGLFHHESAENELRGVLQLADTKLACYIFFLSGVITALISFATSIESYYLTNFASDTLSEATGIIPKKIAFASLLPVAVYDFILYIVAGVVISIAFEAAAFAIIKMSGGKGKLSEQFYLSSVIGLAVSFASVLSLLFPLNVFFSLLCIQIVVGIGFMIALAYLILFLNAKAYRMVHDISMLHAITVLLVVGVPRLAVTFFIMNALAPALGLPMPMSVPGG